MPRRVKKVPAPAPDISAQTTQAWLAIHLIIEGCAMLEALPRVNQEQALAWAQLRDPELESLWKEVDTWLKD